MKTKTVTTVRSPLAEVLPGSQFGEAHSGIVDAGSDRVWEALHALHWTDLRLGWPLMAVRGLGAPAARDTVFETFTRRAGAAYVEEPPTVAWLAMIGKPWKPVPESVEVATIEEMRAYAEPGWLKYGMEWLLHDLGDGRTLVETRTLCEATDSGARRAFRAYWTLIRPFSGVIRLDMIAALRRLTATGRASHR